MDLFRARGRKEKLLSTGGGGGIRAKTGNNKTGLQPVSRPEEQILGFFPKD